jgi:hypothetical protein
MEPDRMAGKGKWIALGIVGIIVIGLGGYYLFSGKPAKEPLPVTEPPKSETAAPAPARALAGRPHEPGGQR